jgi:cytochrome c551/c552
MSRSLSRLLTVAVLLAAATMGCRAEDGAYSGVGRKALAEEIAAWNIDVRPDFDGLPPGSGNVERGQELWDTQCAACHGYFGESTEIYRPIVGGITARDIETGTAATLSSDLPQLTTLSKLSTISTLWDYIHRAMPWTSPKSLSHDDVYALVAYILHLGDIVQFDYELSHDNIAAAQKLLPNRNGTVRFDGLWRVDGEPDVRNHNCMRNCPVAGDIISEFPQRALAASGDPAQQNRPWGPVRGVSVAAVPGTGSAPASPAPVDDGLERARAAGCMACHAIDRALVGPGFRQIADRYAGDAVAREQLLRSIRSGSAGTWGSMAMPPQQLDDESLTAILDWLLALSPSN